MTADRCKETTTTTGTGDLTLLGAVAQFQAFATAFTSFPATVSYAIVGQTGTEWEVGVGTLTDATTLQRTTVQDSSNGGAAVSLSAGTKDVFATLTAQDIADLDTAIAAKADPPPDALATVYVSKAGNDADNGLSIMSPKLTIGSALTAAAALITGGATEVLVDVTDAESYTENITIPANVTLDARAATLIGTISTDSDTKVRLHEFYAAANNDVMYTKTGGTGHSFLEVDRMDGRGTGGALTGVQCVANSSNGSVVFATVGLMYVGASGIGIGDNASGFGHIHFWAADLYLAGNSAIGIRANTANSNIIGYIDHILEISSPTGTIGISVSNGGAIIKATITEIIADEVYNISAGELYLMAAKLTGTRTGTPVFEMSPSTAALLNKSNVFTANGAASTPALSLTGTVFTGGTGTTTVPHFLISPTGATMPTTYSTAGTMLGINAPSGFTGNFLSVNINGGSALFTIASTGVVTALSSINGSSLIASTNHLCRSDTGVYAAGVNDDTSLRRDGAATWQSGADSATPITQTFKSCDARAGTDTNTAGGRMQIGSGRSTGNATPAELALQTTRAGSTGTAAQTLVDTLVLSGTAITASLPVVLPNLTLAQLNALTGLVAGMRANCTDASAPTFLTAITGGGAVFCPAHYSGSAWIAG